MKWNYKDKTLEACIDKACDDINVDPEYLHYHVIKESEKMMVCAARLTQRGHKLKNMEDFMALYNKDYKELRGNYV